MRFSLYDTEKNCFINLTDKLDQMILLKNSGLAYDDKFESVAINSLGCIMVCTAYGTFGYLNKERYKIVLEDEILYK